MYVVLAQSIISLATEQGVELHTEDDLLQCYTVTTNCRVFHEASSPYQGFPWDGKKMNHTYPQYVGVNAFPTPALLTKLPQTAHWAEDPTWWPIWWHLNPGIWLRPPSRQSAHSASWWGLGVRMGPDWGWQTRWLCSWCPWSESGGSLCCSSPTGELRHLLLSNDRPSYSKLGTTLGWPWIPPCACWSATSGECSNYLCLWSWLTDWLTGWQADHTRSEWRNFLSSTKAKMYIVQRYYILIQAHID